MTMTASMSATSYNNDGINDSINDSDIKDSDNKIDIANDNINFVCKSKRECG